MYRFFGNTDKSLERNKMSMIFLGVLFLLTGFLIMVLPEILVAFVASVFLVGGSGFIYLAWKINRIQKNRQRIKVDIF